MLRHLHKGFLPSVCSLPVPGYMVFPLPTVDFLKKRRGMDKERKTNTHTNISFDKLVGIVACVFI